MKLNQNEILFRLYKNLYINPTTFSRQKFLLNLLAQVNEENITIIEVGGSPSQPAWHGLVGLGLHMLDLTRARDLSLSC